MLPKNLNKIGKFEQNSILRNTDPEHSPPIDFGAELNSGYNPKIEQICDKAGFKNKHLSQEICVKLTKDIKSFIRSKANDQSKRRLFGKLSNWIKSPKLKIRNFNYSIVTTKGDQILDFNGTSSEKYIEFFKTSQNYYESEIFLSQLKNIPSNLSVAISILIDCSGSMAFDNYKYANAAFGTAIAVASLAEHRNIPVEVLGFSVSAYSDQNIDINTYGNKKGRIHCTNHIIFKPFSSNNLTGISKFYDIVVDNGGNIDGEAVIWAYNRLKKRKENARIILVLSDGAPSGEPTSEKALNYNNNTDINFYMSNHLRDVVRTIKAKSTVRILGIGMGPNVDITNYYEDCAWISNPDSLPDDAVGLLKSLLL